VWLEDLDEHVERRAPELLPRRLAVSPDEREPGLGCAEAATEDVVEGIEVAPPRRPGVSGHG
jgi:hypothetical protein